MVRIRTCIRKDGDCLLWTGSTNGNGYGMIWSGGTHGHKRYVHRLAYEASKGPIPEGYVIDHLCRKTLCVNPAHLEAVPNSLNVLRGNGNHHKGKTHCARGHAFAEHGGVRAGGRGWRVCRTCAKEETRRFHLRAAGISEKV